MLFYFLERLTLRETDNDPHNYGHLRFASFYNVIQSLIFS
jgi:divalent metal cation (Fe/Co/Zn/Cd) transporter